MKTRRTLACQCGHVVGTWFDERLKKDVCASCVEPRRKAVKPWEADILIVSRVRWQWILWIASRRIRIESGDSYDTREYARAAARRVIKRLGLVEKAKAGKE